MKKPSTPVVPMLIADFPSATQICRANCRDAGFAVGSGHRNHDFGLGAEPERSRIGQRLARVFGDDQRDISAVERFARLCAPSWICQNGAGAHAQGIRDELGAMHVAAGKRREKMPGFHVRLSTERPVIVTSERTCGPAWAVNPRAASVVVFARSAMLLRLVECFQLLVSVIPTSLPGSSSGLSPKSGAVRRIISAATGTAVQPAVRRGSGPEVSVGSSSVTTST